MNEHNGSKELRARQESEARFHDQKYGEGDGYPRHYAVQPTYPIYQRMRSMVGISSGKRILEYGCGEGWVTSDLALSGAFVSAFDISDEAVRKTRLLLESTGFSANCTVETMGAEALSYPDESFDIAVGFAILHHLDLDRAIPELYRVLKPGGAAYFAEPLGGNPVIDLYRRLTPQYRTADEAPLQLDRLAPLLGRFKQITHTDYYVLALASISLAYFPFGAVLFPTVNRSLMALDDKILRLFPGLGRLAWYTILCLRK
jgi:ubiquinone/menaquinone biosynthesis C-methylase UbiE